MPNKLSGTAIQSGTITSTQLSATLTTTIESGGGPKIASIIYPGNDLAANTVGGQTLYITGSGFKSNSTVYINGNNVPSVSYISASNLSFTSPALSSASYPVYVINPEDGATAILIPGLQVSGEPTWVTGATLSEQDATGIWNISLSATGDAPLTYALAAGSSLPTGISLASNGVISGTITTPPGSDTTYNFTVVATDAQNQDSSRAFSVTATTGEGALFANNVLLIHANGTNNQNNHTFLDSSSNNFTITRNGNPTQGTFSPFSQTGWSNYFDGTGDYLTTPSISLSGDFTIEAWMYIPSLSGARGLCTVGDANISSGVEFYVNTSNRIGLFGGNAQILVGTSVTFNINQWNHVAFVRSGGTIKAYLNGVADSTTASNSTTFSGAVRIGAEWYNNALGGTMMLGYISNFRILAGTAAYTTNFTPSTTPLQPVTNTSILTCQSNRFVDEGPYNFTLTRNGDVSVQPFEPFAPVITTANSNSVYFDGTGDYLTVPAGSAFAYGTGDFTVEGWFYATAEPAAFGSTLFAQTVTGTNYFICTLGSDASPSTRVVRFQFGTSGGGTGISTSATYNLNSWNHFAIVRNSGSVTVYLNGVGGTSGSCTQNFSDTSYVPTIGRYTHSDTCPFTGYLSNFRVVKGTAVYTTNFTPSTSPLTAISNTSLLTCQSTTLIDNSTNAFTITPNGNVQPRTLNPFGYVNTASAYSTANVGGSAYFDGTGDYLSFATNSAFNIVTGNFTVECWVYDQGPGAERYIFSVRSGSAGWELRKNATNLLQFFFTGGSSITSASTIPSNAWTHVAATRESNTVRIFINGNLDASATFSNGNYEGTEPLYIGYGTTGGGYFLGYMSNARIVKGTALYTSNFTPPTAPTTNVANTSALLNFTNAGIFDQTAKNVIETVGDAKVSTAQFKYGSASMAFDGTGDYLVIPQNQLFTLGSADFTAEAWVYLTSSSASTIFWIEGSAVAGGYAALRVGVDAEKVYLLMSTSGSAWAIQSGLLGSSIKNQWAHVAVTRSGTSVRVFVNGTQLGTTYTVSGALMDGSFNWIGALSTGSLSEAWTGYMDDIRITRGYARYTANFTPPTFAMKDK